MLDEMLYEMVEGGREEGREGERESKNFLFVRQLSPFFGGLTIKN